MSIDLSGSYRGLIEKVLPDANIIADGFHVIKLIGDEFNSAIIKAKKTTEVLLDSEEKEAIKAALKSSKYPLLKPECNLIENQRIKLADVLRVCPILAKMHQQKESFRNIFEVVNDWETGLEKIAKWLIVAKAIFKESVGTIRRWLVEITGYFDNRTTSGGVEGINNRVVPLCKG